MTGPQDQSARPVLQPLRIGARCLPKRVFLPAHSYNLPWGTEGSPELVAYLERRLKAGVPMAIVGEAEVATPWQGAEGLPPGRIAGPLSRALYEQLADLSQSTGALILEQLHHPGGQVWFEERRAAFAPSAYPQPRSYTLPMTLEQEDISLLQVAFLDAARTVWQTGLAGVELKADQGKLFHQFLSREFNWRRDQYGGNLEGRTRMLRETLVMIRAAAPSEFIVGVRLAGNITASDAAADGVMAADICLQETMEICAGLEAEGLVDYVSISGETNSTVWGYRRNHGDETVPELTFLELTRAVRSVIEIPVLLAGRVLDLDQADRAIASGGCDAVGMARALIADAELLSKASGIVHPPVRPCLSCNLSCVGRTWYGQAIGCIYDPESGRELEVLTRRTMRHNLKVAVIGAGPAGLEFSRIAASLGSKVTLYEQSDRIGGRLNDWSRLPGRSRLRLAVEYWDEALRDQPGVELRLGANIPTGTTLSGFDWIVHATGARQALPVFAESANVASLTPNVALSCGDWTGRKVVVVDGDRYQDPLGIALFIAQAGAEILVVTPFDMAGVGLDPVSRAARVEELAHYDVQYAYWSDVRFSAQDGAAVLYDHCANRAKRLEGYSHVVWCLNPLPNRPAAGDLNATYIGDAVWPRGLEVATREAFDLAYNLHSERVGPIS